MSRAHDRSPTDSLAQRDRRLVTGIAVSVMLHGVLLSLQFGIPGLDAGPGGPVQVTLASPARVPLPVPEPPPVPAAAPQLPSPAPPATAAAPARGLRLLDTRPQPAEVMQPARTTQAAKPKPRAQASRRKSPKLRMPKAPPLIASMQDDAAFAVAPSLPDIEPDVLPGLVSGEPDEKPEPDEVALAARADEEAGKEVERQPQQEADDAARVAAEEQQKLAAETERRLREEQEQLAQREAVQAEERRLAEQQLAEQRLQEQQMAERREAEQRAAEQHAAERALLARQQMEERRSAEAEQQRLAQLREHEEALARQAEQQRAAERLAAERLAAERLAAERLAAEESERRQAQAREHQRAEELAQRQAAEAQARRVAEERARSERLAREHAEEAGRRAAAERLHARAIPGSGNPGFDSPGNRSGNGTRPGSSVPDGAMGTRARELLRGLNIPDVAPPARPVDAPGSRRVLADGAERDVPLRLYVESVRQKLERTAVLGGARFSSREVRIDPLVSLSLRSDGSVDDVTIVRSSGRADMDDAVRRFVQLNARYSAFPPNVAARFDIIEIRRVWRFADGLKLLEEMR